MLRRFSVAKAPLTTRRDKPPAFFALRHPDYAREGEMCPGKPQARLRCFLQQIDAQGG